jgi:pyruvate dehydrogenase E1 component alpha subunit
MLRDCLKGENMTEKLQILDDDGNLIDPSKEPKISKEKLLRALDVMIQVRTLNDKGIRLQRQGRVGFHIYTLGQEAHTGAAIALDPEDWVYPAYREHGMALYREMPAEDIFHHLFANERDAQKGRRLPGLFGNKKINFVNPSAPIGTQVVQAAGTAYAQKYKNTKEVTIVFFGDGATSSNDFHSGMNFGAVTKSPCIFVCQNNRWAISVPLSKQSAQLDLVKKAEGYGMPGIQIDGNDVLAFYVATKEAAERARKGEGPTFIESITYRVGPHTSSDDPTRYRDKKEVEEWERKDPIKRFSNYLINKGHIKEDHVKKLQEKYDTLFNEYIEKADKTSKPTIETMFDDVFAELPEYLIEQLEEVKQNVKMRRE